MSDVAIHAATSPELKKLAELIREVRVAMLVTLSTDQHGVAAEAAGHTHPGLHARPMYTQKIDPETFNGELFFLTDTNSTKTAEVERDRHVLITYAGSNNRFVAVTGEASVERDEAKIKELWSVHAQGWWPGGPEDPGVMLLRVRANAAEYWDGPSTTRYMFSLAKAVITKTRIAADSDHVQMRM